jgi:hypothetical protein
MSRPYIHSSQFDGNGFMSSSLIAPTQYNNPGNLVHNNLPNTINAPKIAEYTLTLDSAHRDIGRYPNPFEYNVSFAPGSTYKLERPALGFNGMIQLDSNGNPIMETSSQEVAGPIVREALKFAKFIRVERAILPRLSSLQGKQESTDNLKIDKLDGDRFTILQIPEFQDECKPCRFGTSQQLSNAMAILTPIQNTPGGWQVYESISPRVEFRSVKDIHNLSIRLLDSNGKKLSATGLGTCNTCLHHSPYNNNTTSSASQNTINIPKENAGVQSSNGGFILDTGKIQTSTTLSGTLSVQNISGAVFIKGTVNSLPVNLHIDPHRMVAGTILGLQLKETIVTSNWNDQTNSGSIDTKTISYHGSLNGLISGVIRVGFGGVDYWCNIDSTLTTANAYGWTNLYWSNTLIEQGKNDPNYYMFQIANLAQFSGKKNGTTYTVGTISEPVNQASSNGSTIGNVTSLKGAAALVTGATNLNINALIGTESIIASGLNSSVAVSGTLFGNNISGNYVNNSTDERTWFYNSGTNIPVLSMASASSGYQNHLRFQGWVGTVLFFSASVQANMSVIAAIIFKGLPGTVKGQFVQSRLVGTFELVDGRTGTINVGYTTGTVVVSDGTVITWDGAKITSTATTPVSTTIWNITLKRSDNWASISGDLGTGLSYWDASACNCQVHPLDPRIQHCLLLRVGVREDNMSTDYRPHQV